jgi:hypothetical protein
MKKFDEGKIKDFFFENLTSPSSRARTGVGIQKYSYEILKTISGLSTTLSCKL